MATGAIEHAVTAGVDDAHPTLSDQALHLVTATQEITGGDARRGSGVLLDRRAQGLGGHGALSAQLEAHQRLTQYQEVSRVER